MMEFHSVAELKDRVMPALKLRKRELKKQGMFLTEDEIWNYFVEKYFKKAYQLSLNKVVDIILNYDIDKDLII